MRYAVFTDIHANLEALEAVLEQIDKIAREKPIDHIWFLGDLVGYGPNPNECIDKLRERTEVIIAGNHDWAAVGKIDLEDFSAAARISAEWTAEQLTEENKTFLANLPERIEIGECTLVHGSPYGPLWEYLTSEVLAERSFQHFSSRFCFVGHTHVPVIFLQPDPIANAPTLPLVDDEKYVITHQLGSDEETNDLDDEDSDETAEMLVLKPTMHTNIMAATAESAYAHPESGKSVSEEEANSLLDSPPQQKIINADSLDTSDTTDTNDTTDTSEKQYIDKAVNSATANEEAEEDNVASATDRLEASGEQAAEAENAGNDEGMPHDDVDMFDDDEDIESAEIPYEQADLEETGTAESVILNAEDRLNSEIEELLSLLGLTESMIQVTNEMILPPEGHWDAPPGTRAIINPGGVGQPRDGNPRAAFMIYDTETGFEFYRIPYAFTKTQEKIIKAGLPPYLAARLAYGR